MYQYIFGFFSILLLSLWIAAYCGFSVFSHIEGWFLHFQIQPLQSTWILCWFALVFGTYWYIPRAKYQWLLLFFLALLGQYFMSLSGENSMLSHTARSGHAEFVITASRDFSIEKVFREYEILAQQPHQRYSPSKPPGQLITYMFFDLLSPSIDPPQIPPSFVDQRHLQLGMFLTFVLPFLAALTTIPFFFLCRELQIPTKKTWLPVFLYSISSPFLLVIMHFDQAIYPLLTTLILYLLLKSSVYRDKIGDVLSFFAGCIFSFSIWISFSMLAVLPIIPFIIHEKHKTDPLPLIFWIRGILYFLLGCLLPHLLFFIFYDYDPFLRYEKAMIHHANWKGWNNSLNFLLLSIRVNVLEWIWWLGPTFVLSLYRNHSSHKNVPPAFSSLNYGMFFIVVLLLCFGKTVAEVNRLWLFLTPLFWIIVTKNVSTKIIPQVIAICVLWTFLLKFGMDFL